MSGGHANFYLLEPLLISACDELLSGRAKFTSSCHYGSSTGLRDESSQSAEATSYRAGSLTAMEAMLAEPRNSLTNSRMLRKD